MMLAWREPMGSILALGWLAIAVVVIVAQIRLFSIDATLKAILYELRNPPQPPPPIRRA
jgi:hypothetical protein